MTRDGEGLRGYMTREGGGMRVFFKRSFFVTWQEGRSERFCDEGGGKSEMLYNEGVGKV